MSMLSEFSSAEREACLPIIDMMMGCAQAARKHGVLALEEFANKQDNDFFTFAIMLVVDGTDPQLVKGMLETLISTGGHTGAALLERIIITEGALSVQAGEHPRLVETKLLCVLGEEFLRKRGHFPAYNPTDELAARTAEVLANYQPDETFSNKIAPMTNVEIQCAFNGVQMAELAIAITTCTHEAATKLLSNLSPRLAAQILDDIEILGEISKEEILNVHNKILANFK
ncbi:MAG: hypothetical protein FWB96_07370 [Defluviitaleaceae bacterium]|nr:hypothetical protein [Defluviitaleaceae bacterium]MCL2262626.1 hypothetical protein [Defluviitaleaceae bacterium]